MGGASPVGPVRVGRGAPTDGDPRDVVLNEATEPAEVAAHSLERVVRAEWGRLVGVLTAELRDLDRAEDAAQDALLEALRAWPVSGLPERPGAWLLVTARRRAIDRLRREATGRERTRHIARIDRIKDCAVQEGSDDRFDESSVGDEELALLFACCHPSLSVEARVALTLRAVCGLTNEEVARLFVVPEATMWQRIVRAKRKIKAAGIPLSLPDGAQLHERVDAVLVVVYLLFTEGYAATAGERLIRDDLLDDATRLALLLTGVLGDDPEVLGLAALLLLTDARRAARLDAHGALVPLEEQDRARWNGAKIERGLALLERASRRAVVGPYQLQAAIAAVHARAAVTGVVNWRAIAELYEALTSLDPSPWVRLNLAVAMAMAGQVEAGRHLALGLEAQLGHSHVFHAVMADLARRASRGAESMRAYDRAITLAPDGPERDFLRRRQRCHDERTEVTRAEC